MKFRAKIVLYSLPLLFIFLFFISVVSVIFQKGNAYDYLKRLGFVYARSISLQAAPLILEKDIETLEELLQITKTELSIKYVVLKDENDFSLAQIGDISLIPMEDRYKHGKELYQDYLYDGKIVKLNGIIDIYLPIKKISRESLIKGEIRETKIGSVKIGLTTEYVEKNIIDSIKIILLVSLLIAIAFVFLVLFLSQKLVGPIEKLVEGTTRISGGDLSYKMEVGSKDEIGELADMFQKMIKNLRIVVEQIQNASLKLSSSSNRILSFSKEEVAGANEQAISISQTSSAIEGLSFAAKKITDHANIVFELANRSLGSAQAGQDAVFAALKGMEEITKSTKDSFDRICFLNQTTQKIGEVIEIINNIAKRTNLLSLNAAVEAVRAGEAGRGFSVVADEIRKLADNVVESTKEIKNFITEIQSSTKDSVKATGEVNKTVEKGTNLSQKVGESFYTILSVIEKTTESAKQIRFSTQNQKNASDQIVQTMKEMDIIAKRSVSSSGQATLLAKELTELSKSLKEVISRFKL